uniref:aminoacyl--tRNA ligase-related protein n=1 Tax=Nocardiopsis lucentensis TaxID=53441 RepID=UPI001F4D1CC9
MSSAHLPVPPTQPPRPAPANRRTRRHVPLRAVRGPGRADPCAGHPTQRRARTLDGLGLPYDADEGEAAFYGPKIDVQVKDGAGRESTLSTVQVDFHQPERFDLRYVGADGARHRPVMVHRSIVGSLERAVAHLLEQHGGAFPAWLAPTQVAVLPVSSDQHDHARAVARRCADHGLRAQVLDPERGSLGTRIRQARLIPYQAVVGAREAADEHLALRLRGGRRLDPPTRRGGPRARAGPGRRP